MSSLATARDTALAMIKAQGSITDGMGFQYRVIKSLADNGFIDLEMREADAKRPNVHRWIATLPAVQPEIIEPAPVRREPSANALWMASHANTPQARAWWRRYCGIED